MASVKILLLSIAAAIGYGLIHDQITARVCIEYFTVGHPRIIASQDPTFLGLVWGVVATWWAGLIIGIPLVLASRIGPWPKFEVRTLVPSVAALLLVMADCAASAGFLASRTDGAVPAREAPELAAAIAPERHHLFIAAWAAHAASYAVGFLGGIVLAVDTAFRRWKLRSHERVQSELLATVRNGN